MDKKGSQHHIVDFRIYIYTWVALLILTGATIYVAGLKLGRLSIFAALFIASLKASLVLYIFMHLKYEEQIFKIILFVVIATLTVIIGLTFLDVGYRQG